MKITREVDEEKFEIMVRATNSIREVMRKNNDIQTKYYASALISLISEIYASSKVSHEDFKNDMIIAIDFYKQEFDEQNEN